MKNQPHEETPFEEAIEWTFRLALYMSVLYIIATGLMLFWAHIKTWLESHDELAGWGQALGSILAIAATAYIALAEARRARQQQGAEYVRQKEAFEQQARLQREMLDFQKAAEEERQSRERSHAIARLRVALDTLQIVAKTLKPEDVDVIKPVYASDVRNALSWIEGVSSSAFNRDIEHTAIAKISTCAADFDRLLNLSVDAENIKTKLFYITHAKKNLNSYLSWLRLIVSDVGLNEIEISAEEEASLKKYDDSNLPEAIAPGTLQPLDQSSR